MITELEKSQIKQLIFSPQWKAIERIMEMMIKQINDDSPLRDTTDETLKEVYLREGKTRGLRDFIQRLLDLSQC